MQYDKAFRLRMVSMLLDRQFLSKFGMDIMLPEYFDTDSESMLVHYLRRYIVKYGRPPAHADVILNLAGDDASEVKDDTETIFMLHVEEGDTEYTTEAIINFARTKAIQHALLSSVDDIEAGMLDKPIERIMAATRVGNDSADIGTDLVADYGIWTRAARLLKVPTGLYHYDKMSKGGIAKGELGVILAPTNKGKSATLVNIGAGAATIPYGADVLHFTLELAEASIQKRYAARFAFSFLDDTTSDADYYEKFMRHTRAVLLGRVRVLHYPSGQLRIIDLRTKIEQLIDMRLADPDKLLIIVDYADLLRLPQDDTRLGLIQLYTELRAMADYFSCPVWTASQTGRQALSKPIITVEDFAEAFGKANVADLVLAKCQTLEEQQANESRLFVAKIRDEKGAGTIITCKEYPLSLALVTTGYTTQSKIEKVSERGEVSERQLRRAIRKKHGKR